jgi:Holliday junction resolvase-like predicted endonuclease
MLDYELFKDVFDKKIFAKSKPDLLEKVATYPDRYVGLFRPTKPQAKLLQNLLQSNEIRFGDAFEVIIEQYLMLKDWKPLTKRVLSKEGDLLDIDQLLMKDNQVLFIEQKVRDDHDSTKKRGQVNNFEKKLETLIELYGEKVTYGFFYFIDPSLVKNRNFYIPQMAKLQESWGVELKVSYGEQMFADLGYADIWQDIMSNLRKWRSDIPDLPEVNFDLRPEESAEEIKELPYRVFRKLFDDERIVEQILPVIFPNGQTLALLEPYFRNQPLSIAASIADRIDLYLHRRVAEIGISHS